jgi:putative ABC transport system permease protein
MMLEHLRQDIRVAVRSLRRTPVFTAAAVVTLALGIGANTAIFSLIEAVLIRSLPVRAPGQLYFVAHGLGERMDTSANYRWLERVRQRTDVFAAVTAYVHRRFKISTSGSLTVVNGEFVSGNYHDALGVRMALGRGFTSEDDRAAGRSPIAVISDGFWSRQFGRSPFVIGQTITVGGHPVTIVGVTAPGFSGLTPGESIDLTLPLSMRVLDEPDFLSATDTWYGLPIVVRLREGITEAAATGAVAAAYREYMTEPFNADFRVARNGQPTAAALRPAAQGDDELRREYRQPLLVLLAMVGIVLLIASINVASLLLVRAEGRLREVGIRVSMGATRTPLIRQFLTESVLLSVIGGGVGLALAASITRFIAAILRTDLDPIVVDVQPDRAVLLFTAVVSMAAGVVFGLAPAVSATRIDPARAIKGAPRIGQRRRVFPRSGLVTVQIAMSLVLVFGAGLFVRTLQNLRTFDAGFRRDGVVVFELDAHDSTLEAGRVAGVCDSVVQRLTGIVDVLSGTCSTMSPIAGNSEGRVVTVDGVQRRPDDPPFVYANSIDARFFETFGMAIVRGRALQDRDSASSAPRVAVIGEAMARRYFGDSDPIGRTFRWGRRDPSAPITIVGVARDARRRLREDARPTIYTPIGQRAEPSATVLAAVRTRTTNAARALVAAMPEHVRSVNRDIALTYVRSMDDQVDASLVAERLLATLASAFAVLALLLAAVGLYGLISYDVARRVREIGVRLAVGATPGQVLVSVLRRTGAITTIGVIAGLVAAAAASRLVTAFLFGVDARDPATLVAATAVLATTAMLAGYFPAQRAARVDPVITLRAE